MLAASDAVSALVYLKHLLAELTYDHDCSMFVDSRALVNLATSIREPAEMANKIDLAFLRERFNPRDIRTFGWVPGYYNIADGMTKDNRTSAALLLRALREGIHPNHPDSTSQHAEHAFERNLSKNDSSPVTCERDDFSLAAGGRNIQVSDVVDEADLEHH